MVFAATIVRKFNPLTIASKWKVLSATTKNYSSSTGYSPEEIEKFRKVFRTMPSYEESISSKDLPIYTQSINYVEPKEVIQKYVEYADKLLDGRFELNQLMKYIMAQHDPRLLLPEYLVNVDRDSDGFVSKEEFQYAMDTVRIHDPRVRHISYEKFLKEADTNGDGKISVAECKDWMVKNFVKA